MARRITANRVINADAVREHLSWKSIVKVFRKKNKNRMEKAGCTGLARRQFIDRTKAVSVTIDLEIAFDTNMESPLQPSAESH